MRKTCPKSEYLLIDERIFYLAQSLLNKTEINEAEELSICLASSKSKRRYAIYFLKVKTTVTPKRPLYYCCHELGHLPHWTREAVRYYGDYIDQLIKHLAAEKLNKPKCLTVSLGGNLRTLKGTLPEPLYTYLEVYNNLIYTPAKHVFSVKNRSHLFTSKEVVFICYITLKLKDEIIKVSQAAKDYSEQKAGYISKSGLECHP